MKRFCKNPYHAYMGVGVYKKRFRFWEEGGTQNGIGEHEP